MVKPYAVPTENLETNTAQNAIFVLYLLELGFNGTSTQFRSLAPSLTRKADTESPTIKESRRYINLANAILISRSPTTASPFNSAPASKG